MLFMTHQSHVAFSAIFVNVMGAAPYRSINNYHAAFVSAASVSSEGHYAMASDGLCITAKKDRF
jgi:hypothetical protein